MLNLNEGQIVQVYKNLNREKQGLPDCWSVKAKVDGKWKVLGYCEQITLNVTKFRVSESARQKVLAVKQKNVHAWIEGTYTDLDLDLNDHITYVPYHGPDFFCVATKEPLSPSNTKAVTFKNNRVYR